MYFIGFQGRNHVERTSVRGIVQNYAVGSTPCLVSHIKSLDKFMEKYFHNFCVGVVLAWQTEIIFSPLELKDPIMLHLGLMGFTY
jgi:hypothetical protein